jgi:DNA-binding transcriptional LysR family regulator
MQVFAHVAELGNFTRAAEQLDLPRGSISAAIAQLEAHLGTRLLHRTMRRVQLTQDGMACLERCRDLLADLDEWQTMFQAQGNAPLRGRVRIDMTTGLARNVVLPRLPELLDRHPLLEIELSSTERRVDLVREGFDCVVRAGEIGDANLIARPLATMRQVNCASPAYLARHGTPQTLDDLAAHRLVHYVSVLGTHSAGFEYVEDGEDKRMAMNGAVTVNSADAYSFACLSGLGIIQAPLSGVQQWLASGELIEILPHYAARPLALNIVYAHRRHLPVRVRVVMDWLAEVIGTHLPG